jgi:hypothetical protein
MPSRSAATEASVRPLTAGATWLRAAGISACYAIIKHMPVRF